MGGNSSPLNSRFKEVPQAFSSQDGWAQSTHSKQVVSQSSHRLRPLAPEERQGCGQSPRQPGARFCAAPWGSPSVAPVSLPGLLATVGGINNKGVLRARLYSISELLRSSEEISFFSCQQMPLNPRWGSWSTGRYWLLLHSPASLVLVDPVLFLSLSSEHTETVGCHKPLSQAAGLEVLDLGHSWHFDPPSMPAGAKSLLSGEVTSELGCVCQSHQPDLKVPLQAPVTHAGKSPSFLCVRPSRKGLRLMEKQTQV